MIATLLASAALPAFAGDDPVIGGDCAGASSFVTVCRQEPASPGSDTSQSSNGKTGSGKQKSRPQKCVVQRLDPQPPAGDPVWQGHKRGDGAIYARVCLISKPAATGGFILAPGDQQVFWSANAPTTTVDPEQLAREAVDRMLLTGPAIASPKPTGRYVVGMPMWMWVTQSPTTYGPNSASATLAGVTVTATAKVSKIDWTMGDGNTVTCQGPGTPYAASYGKQTSPTCGHMYATASAASPGAKYAVTATATWSVNWQVTGGGETGQFTEVRQTQEQVAVGEVQVVR
ncbi:ATP/GTP-binding protein [Streptomyces sp. NPDC001507]|uniref:ATP/GTP-binding protein n=1 Tax=Streptomyces sp. NPDC001507 TaxID=3364579 RepID=UPI0036B9C836